MRKRPGNRRLALVAGVVACSIALLAAFAPPAVADEPRQSRSSIRITDNSQFDAAHGVRSGTGTATDPYVISGWSLSSIDISNTSAYLLITDNTISSTLRLNWDGPVDAINNDVGDLRVNENVPRTGEPTSGVIAGNTFGFVGQLRHFDGTFENNIVGDPGEPVISYDAVPFVVEGPVVNFDGFNGAQFRNNTIYGSVRAQLHGHHHSSGFGESSHQHSGEAAGEEAGVDEGYGMVDHSQRYHELWITGNTIYSDDRYALSWTDTNHAANDRTANSEEERALNDPHVHYTHVYIHHNDLVGSGLWVDIFNAQDERHTGTTRGLLEIGHNHIMMNGIEDTDLFDSKYSAIEVRGARDVDVWINNNEIMGPHQHSGLPEVPFVSIGSGYPEGGIRVWQTDVGLLKVYDNVVSNHRYAVQVSGFKNFEWFLDGLVTEGVEQDVIYDDTAGEPKPRPPEDMEVEPN